MLLVFPPVAKPCEPPAGITKLADALRSHGIPCDLLDANIEGMLHLLGRTKTAPDTWTRRAVKNISSNIAALRDPRTYRSLSRYSRAVRDVNRVLSVSGGRDAQVGLADYQHCSLSPLRSADLIYSADHPEHNPFYPYFSKRLPKMLEKAFSPRGHPRWNLSGAGCEQREEQRENTEYEGKDAAKI